MKQGSEYSKRMDPDCQRTWLFERGLQPQGKQHSAGSGQQVKCFTFKFPRNMQSFFHHSHSTDEATTKYLKVKSFAQGHTDKWQILDSMPRAYFLRKNSVSDRPDSEASAHGSSIKVEIP
jgi:hypothetical protein